MLDGRLKFNRQPLANPAQVVQINQVRMTVITPYLIRMEYSRNNEFRDLSTQTFFNRDLGRHPYEYTHEDGQLVISTEGFTLTYNENEIGFTLDSLHAEIKSTGKVWSYGRNGSNLGGTIRTLDETDGDVGLEHGLMSRDGYASYDDSDSFVFTDDHWMKQEYYEAGAYEDIYLFCYGYQYKACLKDFIAVSGEVPMLPKWTMGNWWSKYWEYEQQELLDLMDEFKTKEIPLSVCIVDMDWHITDIYKTGDIPKSGNASGWTGYTWEKDLFPEPDKFLCELHEKGLKTALNLHPADGLWSHEGMYEEMAEFMGVDPSTKKSIPFNITDKKFAQGYFEIMHHPHEDMGVDFWWMDWQQGTKTKFSSIDPLFVLNHLHFRDMARNNKRPFIFSRWGGLGNHRYPIGFSGDAAATWAGLAFQPYLTSTAANVGYGWWSHDIGGHHHSFDDAELYTRWVQFGVFSPIMRLHSTKNRFEKRLPWEYGYQAEEVAKKFMQLRHQLIPYLYNMSYKNYTTGIPGILPMYYEHPTVEAAYQYGNQYYFGDLLVSPFVKKADEHTGLSRQTIWLPEGDWYHFFTGEYYAGDAHYALYGQLDEMPVFGKAGTIVPMNEHKTWGGLENDADQVIRLFLGNGSFELYEDDGESQGYLEGDGVKTLFTQSYTGNEMTLTIHPAEGALELIPSKRNYTVELVGTEEGIQTFELKDVDVTVGATLKVACKALTDDSTRIKKDLLKVLETCTIDSNKKNELWYQSDRMLEDTTWLGGYKYEKIIPQSVLTAILETVKNKAIYS